MSSRRLRHGPECQTIAWPSLEVSSGTAGKDRVTAGGREPEPSALLEAEWQRRVEEARHAAFLEGEQQGRRSALQQVEEQVARIAAGLSSLSVFRAQLRRDTERELLELSVAIARRILRREVSVDPGALAGIARAALNRLDQRDRCVVAVAPSLRLPLEQALAARGAENLVVEEDPSLQPGDMELRTSRGTLDAGLESQLSEIERGLADRLAIAGGRG